MRYPPNHPYNRMPTPLSGPDPLRDSPTLWFLKKYWWVSLPVAYAFAVRFMERKRKQTLTPYNVMEDFANITAPGLGVLGVIALIRQEHADAVDKELSQKPGDK